MIEFVPEQYYTTVFFWTMFALCLITSLYYQWSPGCNKLLKQNSAFLPLLFTMVLIGYLGLRPVSYRFGDMPLYQHRWNMVEMIQPSIRFNLHTEWFFDYVLISCKTLVNDVQFWFLIIELFYIGCQFWACKRLLWENVWLAIAFVYLSFQFCTFGTNGIRNGMACGMMMLAISFFCDRKMRGYAIGAILFILAVGCHRSVMIPMAALMVSMFVVKDIKIAIYIWIGCVILSLVSGSFFQNFFAGLGIDNRMSTYSSIAEDRASHFSHSGFRWDFLLYSAMPVWLAGYVRSKGIIDNTFTLIANTYIIANSFWVLICRVAFSNRFAYLSWFMYALVIAYAVIRVPIWKDQDKIAGRILLAHSAFTMFMFLFG